MYLVIDRTGFHCRRRNKCLHLADYTIDPDIIPPYAKKMSWWSATLSPLNSVVGGLSAILEHCDVLTPLCHTIHDAYICPSQQWRVAK